MGPCSAFLFKPVENSSCLSHRRSGVGTTEDYPSIHFYFCALVHIFGCWCYFCHLFLFLVLAVGCWLLRESNNMSINKFNNALKVRLNHNKNQRV
jgi:hypothetical protein